MHVWQPVMKGLGQPPDTAQETDKTLLCGGFYPLVVVIQNHVNCNLYVNLYYSLSMIFFKFKIIYKYKYSSFLYYSF